MHLHTLDTGLFKLDGGAMFGVVPKTLWNKLNPADENNMCTWAMRCLLLELGNRLILVDTGIGTKQDAKFFGHYYLHGEDTLDGSIRKAGFSADEITDVLLTHLHFDHVGGAVERSPDGNLQPSFKNATYWSTRSHWHWATHPNARERASFLAENINPIQESGQLAFVEDHDWLPFGPDIELVRVDGHTEQMMLPLFEAGGVRYLYTADLVPSAGHVPLPYVMGYDMRPLQTLEEKASILGRCADEGITLLLEHDHQRATCGVERTERGVKAVL
jgi:glyoxylase-like metal-dependent hydrolase (beta-lactamase superfamily II)